jgi:hypothetical protein
MASCALQNCGSPDCPVCSVNVRFAIVACNGHVDGEPCCLVVNHRCPCRAKPKAGKVERAELKDSKPAPDLSAPRAAAVALGRKRRTRVGPHR